MPGWAVDDGPDGVATPPASVAGSTSDGDRSESLGLGQREVTAAERGALPVSLIRRAFFLG